VIDRSGLVGYNLDTLCIIKTDPITGKTDTTIAIISNLPLTDTIRDTNLINTTGDELCVEIENGMTAGTTAILNCTGESWTNTYTLGSSGCILIDRSGVVGYNLDTLCIIVTDPITGISDTTVAIISNLPLTDTIRDTNTINTVDTICVELESGFVLETIELLSCTGTPLTNSYVSITGTNCFEVTRTNLVGYNLDTLCVILTDTSGLTDTVVVIVSSLPTTDTIRDTNLINTTGDELCVEIENGMTAGTTAILNCTGESWTNTYTLGSSGCILIDRSGVVGYNLDTLCIIVTDPITGISDTTVAIISNLPLTDTIRDTNTINTVDTICVELESGFVLETLELLSCTGTPLTNSYVSITGTNCFEVTRTNLVGYNLDTLCVILTDTSGLTDTVVVIVSSLPTTDTIRDTNLINTTGDELCVEIENGMTAGTTAILNCTGESWTNTYTLGSSGCILIDRSGVVGYNLDTLCIIVTDPITGISDTTVAIISNLPLTDTIRDTNNIYTTGDTLCADIDAGMSNVVTTVELCGHTNNSGNVYTVSTLPGTACIVIDRSGLVGYNLDTLCIIKTDPITGKTDTTIAIISNLPLTDTIRDTNLINTTGDELCVEIENGMTAGTTAILNCTGESWTNTYTLGSSGCILIDRSGVVGYNLDTLCIIVTDPITGISDTTVAIISNLPLTDTIRDTNTINTVDTICVELESGFVLETIELLSCTGTPLTNSYVSITGTNCFEVTRTNLVGYNLDTLCVILTDTSGLTDTVVVIVSSLPTTDTIRDTNLINTTGDELCVEIENGMTAGTTAILNCTGESWTNTYRLGSSGCILIDRSGVVGYNLDTLCIIVTDPITGISDTTVAIISNLPLTDTIRDTNTINTVDTICVELESGFVLETIELLSCTGTPLTNSYVSITGTNCFEVTRTNLVGYNLDTLCVILTDTSGLTDTVVVIVSSLPTTDTIRDTNLINTTGDELCVEIENGMTAGTTAILNCTGESWTNTYTLGSSGCILIDRSGVVGYNLDTLCIIVTDPITGISDTTVAIISNLPNPCQDLIRDTIIPCKGEEEVGYCIPLDLQTLQQYKIYIDGSLQAMSFSSESGCGETNVAGGYSFNANQYIDNVAHVLEVWGIDSIRTLRPNLTFNTLAELALYMNSVDPQGAWYANGLTINAANTSSLYNTGIGLQIFTLVPRVGKFRNEYNNYVTYSGSRIMLSKGCHVVVLEDTTTGCIDSARICVECVECDSVIESTYVEVPCENGEGKYCLPIAQIDLSNYNVFIDATKLNTLDLSGCNYDTTAGYDFSTHILTGGYLNSVLHRLDSVRIDGVRYGPFTYTTYNELSAYLNSINPSGAWVVDGDRIAGGRRGGLYGDMRIVSLNTGVRHWVGYNINELPKGTELTIPSGCHWVVVESKENGCRDSVRVCVVGCTTRDTIRDTTCYGCPTEICVDTTELPGNVVSITSCAGDNKITIDGLNPCVIYRPETGQLGGDTTCIIVCDDRGYCDTTTIIITVLTPKDTLREILPVISIDSICEFIQPMRENITTTSCNGQTSGVEDYISWRINGEGCLVYTSGSTKGTDTLCIKTCITGTDTCFETIVYVSVTGVPPVAVNNDTTTQVGVPVVINVLGNDIKTDSDPLMLCSDAIITQPTNGTIGSIDLATGAIEYIPNSNYIGIDSFQYIICDPEGKDTAWAYIRILRENECELLNAFSPNGDGVNDTYTIPCPSDGAIVLCVYNRWGIEVYRNEDYKGEWDGRYKGSPLPDGTYYYVIKYLNSDGAQINKAGFIVIHR
jgi:gliding motility-associated-like protein